jgi:signal transduction histidine kinase
VGIDDLAKRRWGLRPPPARVVDVLLAVFFLGAVAAERISNPLESAADTILGAVLAAVLAGAIWRRRRFPMSAFVVGTVALCTESLLDVTSPISPYGDQFLVYCVGFYATRNRALWAAPVIVVSIPVYFSGGAPQDATEPLGVLFVWLVTWGFGFSLARRREEQARAERAIRRQVVAEEDARMARELHDIIGHTVNLMVVQAGAARVVLDDDPGLSRDLLTRMETTGREALTDLDQVLGSLRTQQVEPDAEHPVSPGLAQLPDLVSRLGGSQVEVSLSVEPDLALPRSLDLSAYRIVQEALTNVLKHAAPCSAAVAVRRADDGVVVEVTDNGPHLSRPHVPGRGLLGIGERVASCGGRLEQGPRSAGGFSVRAVLPVP